ncbi:uncharacterized protein A4U43_C03F20930 [Asparagus officinalis]|uniref:t-SNARE coiled-coil homology domain-containing protein n=1 Tax=Asparagus officinalis TaxID=4686 RepID=A0A5P1FCJ9_ASPOF|nr:uncharacterized protein A4U43_C03F20930 [Asparagus officinalis]
MSKMTTTRTPQSKVYKQQSGPSGFNPFDSDSESEHNSKPARASSAPAPINANHRISRKIRMISRHFWFGESVWCKNWKVVLCTKAEETLIEGEKLLGSLGGLFSKTWKPKKTRTIKGPILTSDDSYLKRRSHAEQRQRLGLSSSPTNSISNPQQYPSEPASAALEKVQVEKAKQDNALSDLSNLLGELKNMAVDMGSEIERQNKALDHLDDDVGELNFRMRGANIRGLRLLGK